MFVPLCKIKSPRDMGLAANLKYITLAVVVETIELEVEHPFA